jgi:16S rRNA (guanine966-N2)-methyltransferase
VARRAANTLRIIAGEWRGRRIAFADVPGLRPTPDRVRETLFNWLQPYLPGARCLDLFAGSGALGLEALSRGASEAVMVESNRRAAEALAAAAAELGARGARVARRDVNEFLRGRPQAEYDLVFLDPPYRQGLVGPCAQLLEHGGWLAEGALIYVEAERELDPLPLPSAWTLARSRTAGHVGYHLARRGSGPAGV